MKLYHCSKEKYQALTPQVGARRHDGEGAAAVGKPVIWLSNDGDSVLRDRDQEVLRFRHEVEVVNGDPNLQVDERFEQLTKMAEQMYKKPMPLRWYVYTGQLEVVGLAEYDEATGTYVPLGG